MAAGLPQNPAGTVQIVGYTDSSGDDAINNPLSQNRARSVESYFVSR